MIEELERPVFIQHIFTHHLPPQVLLCADLLCGYCCCSLAVLALVAAVWFFRDSRQITGIHEKHVLVTGCDSGFGELAARQLDRRGFHVIAACLTEPGASRLRAAASPRLKTLLLNVTDSVSVESALERVRSETGERGETDSQIGCQLESSTARDKAEIPAL